MYNLELKIKFDNFEAMDKFEELMGKLAKNIPSIFHWSIEKFEESKVGKHEQRYICEGCNTGDPDDKTDPCILKIKQNAKPMYCPYDGRKIKLWRTEKEEG